MNRYTTTTWKAKLAITAVTLAVTFGVLESVVGGLLNAAPETIAARRQAIAAQAEQIERSRALHTGQVKAAEVRYEVR